MLVNENHYVMERIISLWKEYHTKSFFLAYSRLGFQEREKRLQDFCKVIFYK
jgi:hypothetical protein